MGSGGRKVWRWVVMGWGRGEVRGCLGGRGAGVGRPGDIRGRGREGGGEWAEARAGEVGGHRTPPEPDRIRQNLLAIALFSTSYGQASWLLP